MRANIRRGLSIEGNLCFKIDGASLIVRMKFICFALFYFAFEGNFQVQSPRSLYLEGEFNRGFGGLIFGGAHFWNFTVSYGTCT